MLVDKTSFQIAGGKGGMGRDGGQEVDVGDNANGADILVTVHYPAAAGYRLELPGGEMLANGEVDEGGTLLADLDGLRVSAAVVHEGDNVSILFGGRTHRIERVDPMALRDVDLDEGGKVTAPLPGKIVQVQVEVGTSVGKGDPLLILEAMKMEHTITAPRDAVIAGLPFASGEQVEEGVELVIFEASPEA